MKDKLYSILAEPEVYPIEITLDCGGVVTIPHADYVHYTPRQTSLVYFPPERKGEHVELIALDKVMKVSLPAFGKSGRRDHFFNGSKA